MNDIQYSRASGGHYYHARRVAPGATAERQAVCGFEPSAPTGTRFMRGIWRHDLPPGAVPKGWPCPRCVRKLAQP